MVRADSRLAITKPFRSMMYAPTEQAFNLSNASRNVSRGRCAPTEFTRVKVPCLGVARGAARFVLSNRAELLAMIGGVLLC